MSDYPKMSGEKGGQPAGAPIAMQPMPSAPPGAPAPTGWMPAPQAPPNCPPGLEYLAQVDQLLVKQKVEGLEMVTGYETNNKYEILNTMGQRVFYAVEDTCCCTRNCCGHHRPWDIKILNNQSKEVMHLSRGLRCNTCLCPCCLQKVTVEAPTGHVIGYVSQAWSLCKPRYNIQTANEETVLRIKGPCCTWNMCGDIEFDVSTADETSFCGRITKQWSGLAKEAFTDADNYGISFPMDLDINVKAVLIGAVFLITAQSGTTLHAQARSPVYSSISFPMVLHINMKAVLIEAIFLIDFMYFENNTKSDKKKIKHVVS